MATPQEIAKSQLRNYVLRQLGSPYVTIELTNEQIDDKIEEAIYKFHQFHFDGSNKQFIFLNTSTFSEYKLPSNVIDVSKVYAETEGLLIDKDEPLLLAPYFYGNMTEYTSIDLVSYELFMQQRELIQTYFEKQLLFEFNETTRILYFYEVKQNTLLALECYLKREDETEYYSNIWFKNYLTALCKIQWAANIGKYEGTMLPGGISLNYQKIRDEGIEEKNKLEEQLDLYYKLPYEPHLG